ncbi:hypothetical protein LCGC14_2715150, partial [marine sediment metagenome]
VEYSYGVPKRVQAVVIAAQHDPDVDGKQLWDEVTKQVIRPVLGNWLDDRTDIHVNSSGSFILGGPAADSGLSGRKNIVDTYGGIGRHGGGSYSGKDPSKVDRSASYMARHIAKNIVAARLARACEVQLSYAIGVAEPISILIDCEGTEVVAERRIAKAVRDIFPLTPAEIIDYLKLLRPIYQETAHDGHFGRNGRMFTWEKTNRTRDLRKACGM